MTNYQNYQNSQKQIISTNLIKFLTDFTQKPWKFYKFEDILQLESLLFHSKEELYQRIEKIKTSSAMGKVFNL